MVFKVATEAQVIEELNTMVDGIPVHHKGSDREAYINCVTGAINLASALKLITPEQAYCYRDIVAMWIMI